MCTYQFNFKFSLEADIYAQDSIDLLTNSGIDFKRRDYTRFHEITRDHARSRRVVANSLIQHDAYEFGSFVD